MTTLRNMFMCVGIGQYSQETRGSPWINLLSNVPSIGCIVSLIFQMPCVSLGEIMTCFKAQHLVCLFSVISDFTYLLPHSC